MSFATTLKQRNFFKENGYVEFDKLLVPARKPNFSQKRRLASIASELSNLPSLCLACSRVLNHTDDPIAPATLASLTALQSPLFGLMLALETKSEESSAPPFPSAAGNGIFFSSDLEIDFTPLYTHESSCYLLLVFSGRNAVVVAKEHPLAWSPKGLDIGDRYSTPLLVG